VTTPSSRFDGLTAIVTGGRGGIGGAVVDLLLDRGATVLSCDVDAAAVEDRPARGQVTQHRLDVTSPDDWQQIVAVARHGRQVDVLVNAAGVQGDLGRADLVDGQLDHWHDVLAVNLTGTYLGCRTVLPAMSPGAAIVNVSSIAAFYPTAYNPAYGVSKAGVTQLTKTVAAIGAERGGIRCNSVHPGFVDTAMTAAITSSMAEGAPADPNADFVERIPLGRPGAATEIAELIAFLASKAASYITGAELTIDGGSRLVR